MLEVIIDYGSAFDTYGKVTETKSSRNESSFPAEVPPIKFIGAANFQSPVIARKFLPQWHRNTRLGCVLTNSKIQITAQKVDVNVALSLSDSTLTPQKGRYSIINGPHTSSHFPAPFLLPALLTHVGSSASLNLHKLACSQATIKDFTIIINFNLAVWYLCLQECRKVLLL